MSALSADEFLDSVRRDGQALADAAERAGMATTVAACPGWNVADLVWHTAEVHWFWRHVVELQVADHAEVPAAVRPPDDELLAFYRDGVERLHAALASTPPETPVWTWAPQRDVAFVQRRMAQETAVHRWDAEAAAGAGHAIDPVLARDGIDEFLDLFLPEANADPVGGTVHLHCTDVDGEWLVRDGDDGELIVTREHAKGDVAVRGPGAELLLLLWRRRTAADVEVFGDAQVLDRFLARTDLE
jgi:uncharacterized protein (TIGR03083 family)